MLFCDRPHVDSIDYATARFIVCKACGLDAGGRHYEMGDEITIEALNEIALRQIYEPPLRLIELLEYGVKDPSLLAATLRRAETCSDDTPDDEMPDMDYTKEDAILDKEEAEEKELAGSVMSLPTAEPAKRPKRDKRRR